jgi:hypothetical protein
MSTNAYAGLPQAVLSDMLGGIDVPVASSFGAGMELYRFSSSHLFAEGFYVSPWWFKKADFDGLMDTIRADPELLSARARSGATIPVIWSGNNNANFLDRVVSVQLRKTVVAFRGPGRDQTSSGGKIVRAPRGVMQNFLPALSWRNVPKPNLLTARDLFTGMSVHPISLPPQAP